VTERARILVIDDNDGIRDICARTLRQAGYDVQTAASGDEALPLLRAAWDIVVTDLSMPGKIGGIDVLRKTRAFGVADVLIMTASPALETAIEAIREGAYDYLIKPITSEMLRLTVARCLERRALSRELIQEKALRAQLDQAYAELSRLERLKQTFGQFVTPEVAEFVMAGSEDIWKRGERKPVTMMFVDVRRFTPFAETASPEQAVDFLNQIFGAVIAAVQAEGGLVNKFMGDGILALFGAPVPRENHALAAARAALRAQASVATVNAARKIAGLPVLSVGIGINTGDVVAGCLGSETRAEYSVIGHAVNLASRLESESGPGQILIGPETASLIGEAAFTFGLRIPLLLPGIAAPVIATELVGERLGQAA
jgi:class 3 adenylate cyclase/CheY-like chemotaxis protein